MSGAALDVQHCIRDLLQSCTENRMGEIGARLSERGDRISLRHGTLAKAGELREDVPHPVRTFAAAPDLCERTFVIALLGTNEALGIERIGPSGRNASSTLPAPAPLPDSPAYPDVMNSVPPATVGPGPLSAPPFASTPFTVANGFAVSNSQSTFPSLVE